MRIIYKGVIESVEYKIVRFKRNGHVALYIKCPRCSKFGRLSKYKNGFLIRHKVNGTKVLARVCQFGWTCDEHETLKKIYKMKDELIAGAIMR